jgi:cytochrome c biogenesis protein CcmG/thiol:disulfide interchange protein DsbE
MEDNNKEDLNVAEWVDGQMAVLGPDSSWRPDAAGALGRIRAAGAAKHSRGWTWAVAVLLAAAFAVPESRALAQRIWVPCRDACRTLLLRTMGTAPLAAAVKAGKDRTVAPDFTLQDANGRDIRLADYRGKVVLLNFWATWCGPCVAEIPWFNDFERAYRDKGFAVIGVSMDEDGWKSVRPYMEAQKIAYRVGIGDEALAAKFGGIESLPETLLIDREGRIAARHVGIVARSEYESEIAQLLK